MNINVGDYVRTIDGYIRKIIAVNKQGTYGYLCKGAYSVDKDYKHSLGISAKKIKKSSTDIINLIKNGDLVNIEFYSPKLNKRVTRLFEVNVIDCEMIEFVNYRCKLCVQNGKWMPEDKLLTPLIKSILTGEQFKEKEYKIDEQKNNSF